MDINPHTPLKKACRNSEEKVKSFCSSTIDKMGYKINPYMKKFGLGFIYGLVNVVLAIPVMYGYNSIIFSSDVYIPHWGGLVKLLLLSSATHQLTMSLFSGFPFAIGQVQDAGLIFLHKMTLNVAQKLQAEGQPPEVILATALMITALSTLSLGFMMILIGKLKLARFISYLPVPVVGGYLAFIGAFCIGAGVSFCTGITINGYQDIISLFNKKTVLLVLPGLLVSAFLTWVCRRFRNVMVLPLAIVGSLLIFYVVLLVGGISMEAAREFGYMGENKEPASFTQAFEYFDFRIARYDCILVNIPVWLGMVLIVSFSSCLDVAAIEMDMGKPVKYDSEIMVIGLGNILSGCSGGFTGSYIFSQTIFTYRTQCNTRLVGMWVIAGELLLFFLYFDPMTYVPLYFFAAMLIFIGFDLVLEWIWEVRLKLTTIEYLILLTTFATMCCTSLDIGIAVGLGLSVVAFVLSFASETMHIVKRVFKSSRILHPTSQRQLLGVHRDKILCIELRGELNFVSAFKSLQQIMKQLGLGDKNTHITEPSSSKTLPDSIVKFLSTSWGEMIRRKRVDMADEKVLKQGPDVGHILPSLHSIDVSNSGEESHLLEQNPTTLQRCYSTASYPGSEDTNRKATTFSETGGLGSRSNCIGSLAADYTDIPSFVLLDCHHLTQIDSSAAKSFFLPIKNLTEHHNIFVVFASLSTKTRDLLEVNGALEGDRVKEFTSLSFALEYCELSLIRTAVPSEHSLSQFDGPAFMLGPPRASLFSEDSISMENVLKLLLDLPESYDNDITEIKQYCKVVVYPNGSKIFTKQNCSECFFVLLSGLVEISDSDSIVMPGSIFGYVDHQLEQRRSCSATAVMDCIVCMFDKSSVDRLGDERPQLCILLERAVLKHMALSFSSGTHG